MIDAVSIERAFETGQPQRLREGDANFEVLKAAGLVREAKLAKTIYCTDCLAFHVAERTGHGLWEIACEAGHRIMPESALRQWRVVASDLVELLRLKLDLADKSDERISDSFWLLGRFESGGGGFPLWLLRNGSDASTLDAAARSLSQRAPREQGLIIAASSQTSAMLWPLQTGTVRLCDILPISDAGVRIDRSVIWDRAPPGKVPKRARGRPPKNDFDIIGSFRKRVRSGTACRSGVGDEARALRALQVEEFGSDLSHSEGHIESRISPDYKLWEASGFSLGVEFP